MLCGVNVDSLPESKVYRWEKNNSLVLICFSSQRWRFKVMVRWNVENLLEFQVQVLNVCIFSEELSTHSASGVNFVSVLTLGHLSLRWRSQSQSYHSSTDYEPIVLFYKTGFTDIWLACYNLYVFEVCNFLSFDIWGHPRYHRHNEDSEHTHHPKSSLCPSVISPCCSTPLPPPTCFLSLHISLHFLEFCIWRIISIHSFWLASFI